MTREEQIERAREMLASGALSETACKVLKAEFPELSESEDERIRNKIQFLLATYVFPDSVDKKELSDCLAWLEKKKEQEPGEQVDYTDASWFAYYQSGFNKGYGLGLEAGRKEQKPAEWSEEEKEYVRTIKSLVADAIRLAERNEVKDEVHGKIIAQSGPDTAFYQRLIDWVEGRHIGQTIEWKKYEDGHRFDSDTVVIGLDGSEPRLVRCAVSACYGIAVEDLKKLPFCL